MHGRLTRADSEAGYLQAQNVLAAAPCADAAEEELEDSLGASQPLVGHVVQVAGRVVLVPPSQRLLLSASNAVPCLLLQCSPVAFVGSMTIY